MNLVWSILNGGRNPSDGIEFARRTTSVNVGDGWEKFVLEKLFPESDEQYRCFLVETVTSACIESTLGDRFLALDPVNTYDDAFPNYSHDHHEHSPSSLPMNVLLLPKESAASRDVANTWACSISSTGTLRLDGDSPVDMEMGNGLSKEFQLGSSLAMRLRGVPSDFSFMVTSRRTPQFNMSEFLARLENLWSKVKWTSPDLKQIWREGQPVDRMAVFVLNLVTSVLEA